MDQGDLLGTQNTMEIDLEPWLSVIFYEISVL